jgi:fibronectin-binding autotransporter adhesin
MNKNYNKSGISPLVCTMIAGLVLFNFAAGRAVAAADTWTGGGSPDGNWQNANNWGGVAPLPLDFLFFDGATQTSATNNFAAGTMFGTITFNSTADPFTLYGNSIALTTFTNGIDASTVLPVSGNITNMSFNTETVNLPITLSAGRHGIATLGGGQLNLNGPISRSTGATVVFSPSAGNINVAGGFDTNGLNNILGAWATIGNDWATLDATSNIVAYADYTTVASGLIPSGSTINLKYVSDTANIYTSPTGSTINSLITEQSASRSLTITNQLRLGAKGGIYRDGAGTGVMTVTGGSIVADGGGEITFSDNPFNATGNNNLNIVSVISNDTANVVSVNTMGYVQFGASSGTVNTYSGGTYINQGRVQVSPLVGFGTGPVYVFPSGEILFNSNGTYTNSFFIGGVGTAESGGLGAFRMGGSGRIISGKVTLMGDAVIGNNGTVSGQITGSGRLFIGHGTSGNGHGVIVVGGATPNDYSGDTIIGSANQASDTLRMNAGFNNIMPHGAGKGNVILNGGSSTIAATFDLNGTTQTINGLTNTATSPATDFVTNSSATAATLMVGDNNASATFGGKIVGPLSVTKIGSGTLILNGVNSYANATTVNGGVLFFDVGSFPPSSSPVTINSNAALDLSAVTPLALSPTATLSMSNGTVTLSMPVIGAALTTPTLIANGTTNLINVASIPAISTYPATITAIRYTNLTGVLNFGLGTLPVSGGTPFAAYVSNNVANSTVDLVVTAGPTSIKWQGYAGGSLNSTWDIGSTPNWVTFGGSPTTYSDGSFVQLDDSASNNVVTLVQDVSPAGITITNSSLTYTINGGNKIGGLGGLTKRGSGTVIFDNTGLNDFSGDVFINNGTLQIGNNDGGGTIPATASVVDNGTLVYNRTDPVTVPNTISGNGNVTQNGSGTLTLGAANTFNGTVTVGSGATLVPGNSAALGTTNGGTVVSSGGTLDVGANAINLGQEPITISGTGVGGAGALVNSSGSLTFVGPNAARVTMVGDTYVGGSGRFDLRANPTSDPKLASLSTQSQPWKLTKVGAGSFGLIGITVDPQLGDIEVQQGILSTEASITGVGNPNSNLFVWPGGTFQMFAVTNLINKIFTLGSDGFTTTVSATSGTGNTIIGPMNITNDCFFNVNTSVALTLNNVISGPGRIVKIGAGLLTLSGNSPNYAGGLQLNSGSVAISGVMSNNAGVTVSVGTLTLNGILLGAGLTNGAGTSIIASGTNAGIADISGNLYPGPTNSIATFNIGGGLILEPGGSVAFDLGADTTPGSGSNDLIAVTGDLTVNGNSLTINPMGILQTGISHPYVLFTYTGNLIWNGDLSVTGPNNYIFAVDTNTPGQVRIVASGGPPVWNGGSATTSNWSDPANWSGVTISSGNALFFAGSTRLNNNNDTPSDTSYTDIEFINGAGAFILNGNPIALGGSIINNSSNPQTINIGLDFNGTHTLNGASSPLIVGGGVTNNSGLSTLTLSGAGTLTNLIAVTDPNSMTNIISVTSNANWTLTDNTSSTPITTPVQLDILGGTINFGQGASAPVLSSTASANNSRLGVTPGAPAIFNMVNGSLNLTARLNTGAAAGTIAALNQTGGTINVALFQSSDGSANASTTINVSGGTFNVSDSGGFHPFYLASRGTGMVSVATSGVINCSTLDLARNAAGNTSGSIGTVNLNAGGTIACSRVGTATSSAQAGPPSSGVLPSATFNFNGGVLKATASSTTFYQGNAASPAIPITSIVKSGGAIIDTDTNAITVLEPLQHDAGLGATKDGGLLKMGPGALTLTAASTYTGDTIVTNGNLAINGSLGMTAVSVATNATLSGTGTAGTNVIINGGGTLSPAGAGAAGTLTVAGNVTLQPGATNFMELNKSLASSDQVRATAATATTITYAGTLSVTNLAGTLSGSDTFKLFSASNYLGSFSAIIPATPAPGLAWDTSTLATDGTLRFTVTVNTTPTNIVTSVSGNQLTLTWPADHTGWRLQVQTNSISTGLGTNWVDVPGSTSVDSITTTIDSANGTVFYRMVYP